MVDPVTGHIVHGKGSEGRHQPSVKGDEFHVEFVDAPPRSWIGCTSSEEINVDCSEDVFQITLPSGRLSGILVLGINLNSLNIYCLLSLVTFLEFISHPFALQAMQIFLWRMLQSLVVIT